jgi:hypothetical protein
MVINEYLSMVIIGSLCCSQLNDDKGIKMVGVLENRQMMFRTIANHVNIMADQRACDNLIFGPHTLVYFDRGRARHLVRTCRGLLI